MILFWNKYYIKNKANSRSALKTKTKFKTSSMWNWQLHPIRTYTLTPAFRINTSLDKAMYISVWVSGTMEEKQGVELLQFNYCFRVNKELVEKNNYSNLLYKYARIRSAY